MWGGEAAPAIIQKTTQVTWQQTGLQYPTFCTPLSLYIQIARTCCMKRNSLYGRQTAFPSHVQKKAQCSAVPAAQCEVYEQCVMITEQHVVPIVAVY